MGLAARLAASGSGALAERVGRAVEHLYRLVAGLRLSPDDLRQVLEFLTELGLACDARRREWVLRADVAGSRRLWRTSRIFDCHGVEMNQRYRSTAAVSDGQPEPAFEKDAELH